MTTQWPPAWVKWAQPSFRVDCTMSFTPFMFVGDSRTLAGRTFVCRENRWIEVYP